MGQGHAAVQRDVQPTPAAGRGRRWARARGAGPRGLEVLMLLISIDFPGSSAYRQLRLGRPEGQLSSAGAAGKMLGQQVLPVPPPAHGEGPPSRAAGEGWSGDAGTGTLTAPATLHLGGEAARGSPRVGAHVPVPGLGSAQEPWGWPGWGGTGEMSSKERSGDSAARRGTRAAAGPQGSCSWCWMHPKRCRAWGGHLCRQRGGKEAQAALQEGRRRQQQQRCSRGVCAHREDSLEVVEQLDVLGDPRAGPADHVVLAARGRQGGEEPAAGAGHQDSRAGAQRVPAQQGFSQAKAAGKQPTSKHRAQPLPAPAAQTPCPTSGPSGGTRTGPAWPSPAAGGCQPSPACGVGSLQALWGCQLTGPLHRATLPQWYLGYGTG